MTEGEGAVACAIAINSNSGETSVESIVVYLVGSTEKLTFTYPSETNEGDSLTWSAEIPENTTTVKVSQKSGKVLAATTDFTSNVVIVTRGPYEASELGGGGGSAGGSDTSGEGEDVTPAPTEKPTYATSIITLVLSLFI